MANLMSDAKQYYNYLQNINKQNNAASQANAREQMLFQERMSSTAHQREVADLKAAGLNPVLSVGGSGGGASAPSGAMGQTDMSSASALTSYLQGLIQQQTSLSVAQMQANAQITSAGISAQAMRDVANINAQNPNTEAGLVRAILQHFGFDLTNNSGQDVSNSQNKGNQVADNLENVARAAGDNNPSVSRLGNYFNVLYNYYMSQHPNANPTIAQFNAWLHYIATNRGEKFVIGGNKTVTLDQLLAIGSFPISSGLR